MQKNTSTEPEDLSALSPSSDNEADLLPADGHPEIVLKLLENGLPVIPNIRQINKDRIAGKTIEQMVTEIGDPWAASANLLSMSFDLSNPAYLFASFKQNMRVKKLIQEGRKWSAPRKQYHLV